MFVCGSVARPFPRVDLSCREVPNGTMLKEVLEADSRLKFDAPVLPAWQELSRIVLVFVANVL